jgi:hypothetical protein
MVYYSADHELLLFGGWNPITGVAYNATWKFAAGVWTNITTAVGPSPRYGASMSDDPQEGVMMLFGGVTPQGTYLGDSWWFSSGHWIKLVTPGNAPTPSAFGSVGNDESDGNVMLLGGYNGNYVGQYWVMF